MKVLAVMSPKEVRALEESGRLPRPSRLGQVLTAYQPLKIAAEGTQEQLIASAELGLLVPLAEGSKPAESPGTPSTQEVIAKFLAAKRPRVKPISLKSYELNLRTFARHYPILPTEPEPVEQYLGRYSTENTGINNIDTLLRQFYGFAKERLGLPNPMEKIKPARGKAKPPQHLTISQALLLQDAIQDDRERGLWDSMFGLGLRLSEVRRLNVIDVAEDTILIHGKERTEPMPLLPETRDVLLKLTAGKRPDEPVFSGRNGQPLSDSMIQLIVKRLFQRAGITGVRPSPHTLRHSRGVICDIAGLDDYSSRRLLRHADTAMTDRYSALNLEELRAKEEKYNPLRVLARQLGRRP